MKTKLLGIGLVFSLLVSPAWAQEEALLEDEAPTPVAEDDGGEDLFGDDFFSDLDSFLEQEDGAGDQLVAEEEAPAPVPDPEPEPERGSEIEVLPEEEEIAAPAPELEVDAGTEELQSSAFGNPGSLPSSADVSLSVINISQDNTNAVSSGVRPGDVLRYEVSMSSALEDVVDYVPVVDVSAITDMVEFTNTGLGLLEGGRITYPAYSHKAPCEQVFTFFVRVLDNCDNGSALRVSSPETGAVSVNLDCGLTQTGPTQQWFLLAGLVMLIAALMFTVGTRRTS